mgnify:CR=1 FL=1
MPLKSDSELLTSLCNEVSRIQYFLVILAFLGTFAFAVLADSLSGRITDLEASIAELKGQDDE